eukprot:CAMPEP_0196133090 /NCGR_PEP_ID=MMETSP0910-20130528/2454_1 /TAXON_ID=49265 /ORGANISM="Thalassiosira rotula, Strain GSO102" /LENGTH=383 /DNA_ID=CAMNT_0041392777 /DNA_START=152 /DNA_END=1303 /DNA_ORIENTATION=-
MDPNSFPSPSQARRAIQHGRLVVLRADDHHHPDNITTNSDDYGLNQLNNETILDSGSSVIIADPTTTIRNGDVVAIRSRIPNAFYPQWCTKYVDPPSNFVDIASSFANGDRDDDVIVYEDDHIAIVNKPEGMNTIAEKRNDFQSILPFVLHPPTPTATTSVRKRNRSRDEVTQQQQPQQCRYYLPRPIHRLDRRTSGCVLVAKSERAMKKFSQMFATRQIQKSYYAITFGKPRTSSEDDIIECTTATATTTNAAVVDGKPFSVIDYPIDGKSAVTLWRTVTTISSPALGGELSLLHLLPKTGRNHQIRRHLSYCLSCPIVGDSKYDGGGPLRRAARGEWGMFLCSNSVRFRHVMSEDEDVVANVPLPDKFYELLGLDKEDVLL